MSSFLLVPQEKGQQDKAVTERAVIVESEVLLCLCNVIVSLLWPSKEKPLKQSQTENENELKVYKGTLTIWQQGRPFSAFTKLPFCTYI